MIFTPRIIQKQIEDSLFKGKIIIIYGARQVGKTVLSNNILANYKGKSKYLNCELLSIQEGLGTAEAVKLKAFLGDYQLIVLDEAQNIKNIGLILKIIVDTYPEIQIIATGSSSFDLANKTGETLTGRASRFTLFPLSLTEILTQKDLFFIESKLDSFLRFGSYPEIFFTDEQQAKEKLNEIVSNYLYKDILIFEGIKKSSTIINLLKLLALQIGNEVSYDELAKSLGVSRLTVQKYLNILEQSFVIYTLKAFSRNLRKEISKAVKIYFCDLGIRNSLIQNFNNLDLRNDVGALWENFIIMEKIKNNLYQKNFANLYFWRTYDQKEIDLIEERDGKLFAYELKFKKDKTKTPTEFLNTYSEAEFKVINKENYWEFLKQS